MLMLTPQPFLELVLAQLTESAAASVGPWQSRVRHRMLQIHFGNPRVHYELWLQTKAGRVELGLHFEDQPELNLRWGARFAARVFELQEALGPEIELEEWTASWTRLHLTVPYEPLTAAFAAELAERFGRLIEATAEDVRRGLNASVAR
jgi:hypothetical protein